MTKSVYMTINHDSYMATPPDMSGSVAKNRFRAELLWGVEKLLDCLDNGIEDFAVVFDYRCDIELHLDDGYEFYQVKTSSAEKFGVSWACKKGSKTHVSIIGRLYELHDMEVGKSVRLIIVGNKSFIKSDGNFEKPGELLFSTLNEKDKKKVEDTINEHLPTIKPDINKMSYLLVAMDLAQPDYYVAGHLVKTYEKTVGYEVRKPNALFRALQSLVKEKACEERKQPTYEEVIKNKAITSNELSALFNKYADKENSLQDYVLTWIDKQPPLQQNSLKCAYEEVAQNWYTSKNSRLIQAGIEFMEGLDDTLTTDMIVERTSIGIKPVCGIEISLNMRKIYAVIALHEILERGH